jgi:PAS domain S-box-containing protein
MILDLKALKIKDTAVGGTANRVAASVVAVSFLTVAVLAPMARTPLTPINAFIPGCEAALVITDLLTAFLLFAHFYRQNSGALLLLCTGYLFASLIIIPHALTFPGVFAPEGLLGAVPQTTAWLYLFWHAGFALSVLGYALMSRPGHASYGFRKPAKMMAVVAAAVASLVVGLTMLSTKAHSILPPIMDDSHYSVAIGISALICLISLMAIYFLWRSRQRSTLDVWLLVVMCAWLCDVVLSAAVGAERFDLGWYAGRSFGLLASSFLLMMLLAELAELYVRPAQADLHRATALFEAIINMTPDLVFVKDLESRALLRNPAARFGRSWEEMDGQKEADWHAKPEEAEQVVANDRQVIASGKSMQFVERFTTHEGERLLLSTKSPLFDEAGKIVGTIGVCTDITEREKRIKHTELIMRELTHRSKNLLSVILAIARQSAKQSVSLDQFSDRFVERLSALARLHDLLVQEEWNGASLHAVVKSQVAPFAGDRVSIEGPDVTLGPAIAQTLCMVFHELATNALKYGSLSNEEGKVLVSWGMMPCLNRLFLQWQEIKGPPVSPPQRRGFGSVVIERMSLQIKDASASLKYPSTGITWYLEAPYESFVWTFSTSSDERFAPQMRMSNVAISSPAQLGTSQLGCNTGCSSKAKMSARPGRVGSPP